MSDRENNPKSYVASTETVSRSDAPIIIHRLRLSEAGRKALSVKKVKSKSAVVSRKRH